MNKIIQYLYFSCKLLSYFRSIYSSYIYFRIVRKRVKNFYKFARFRNATRFEWKRMREQTEVSR